MTEEVAAPAEPKRKPERLWEWRGGPWSVQGADGTTVYAELGAFMDDNHITKHLSDSYVAENGPERRHTIAAVENLWRSLFAVTMPGALPHRGQFDPNFCYYLFWRRNNRIVWRDDFVWAVVRRGRGDGTGVRLDQTGSLRLLRTAFGQAGIRRWLTDGAVLGQPFGVEQCEWIDQAVWPKAAAAARRALA